MIKTERRKMWRKDNMQRIKVGFPADASGKESACQCRRHMRWVRVWSLGQDDPLEKEMAVHSSILAWKIPRTEEPDGLRSMGWQRVGHDWAHIYIEDQVRGSNIWLTGIPLRNSRETPRKIHQNNKRKWPRANGRCCFQNNPSSTQN